MSKVIKGSNHNIGTIDHFEAAILRPDLIPEMFYEGQVCPHGHRLRHKANHWCFNCAFKIYANQCGKNINHLHPDYHKYYFPIISDLPTDLDPALCWDLPDESKISNKSIIKYTSLTYRTFKTNSSESINLSRYIYAYFWGDIGTLVTSNQCKNSACWNPLHIKSKFNVKPMPNKLNPFITTLDVQQLKDFELRLPSIEDELRPKLKIIKNPKDNAEVEPGSKFRPLESQFLVSDRLRYIQQNT